MGFIYVLSNPALPGQLKVGQTRNSIRERVGQLNASSSIPKKFIVEYHAELKDDVVYVIEQAAHAELDRLGFHYGKEYFKCSVGDCKNAIAMAIAIAGAIVLHAEDGEATRVKVAKELQKIKSKQDQIIREAEQELQLRNAKEVIIKKYQLELDKITNRGEFVFWWMPCTFACGYLINQFSKSGINTGGIVLSCIFGALVALIIREYDRSCKKDSQKYLEKNSAMNAELSTLRTSGIDKTAGQDRSQNSRSKAFPQKNIPQAPKSNFSTSGADPPNSSRVAEWVFDQNTGDLFEINNSMLFSTKNYQRNRKGFHVMMFKLANYSDVYFLNGQNPDGINPQLVNRDLVLIKIKTIKISISTTENKDIRTNDPIYTKAVDREVGQSKPFGLQANRAHHINAADGVTSCVSFNNRKQVDGPPGSFDPQVPIE